MCVWHFYEWLGIFPWACIKMKIPYSPWSLSREVVFVIKLDVEAQVKHLEESLLDAFHPCGDCGHMKICQRVSPIMVYGGASLSHVGVWGSNLQVFIKRSLC